MLESDKCKYCENFVPHRGDVGNCGPYYDFEDLLPAADAISPASGRRYGNPAKDRLQKPFLPERLAAAIQVALEGTV